ncbi:hypothetical protein SRRS_13600 [Sporomusa rhizae]|uniref:HsmA family protein n=1 Tax=Sporomusa rhizae TaxID=357999 RepID=UPI00352A41F9
MLLYAIIFINMAFVLYTIGVWSEKIQGKLKPWHLAIFWAGLVNDTIGTLSMEAIANHETSIINYLSPQLNFHSISGTLALILMLCHALWATIVLIKKDVTMATNFHQFSLLVWVVWLVPFVTGVMSHIF